MKKLQYFLVAVFILFLILPMIRQNFVKDEIASVELRNPAKLPSFSLNFDDFKVLPKKIDLYLNDHFGFRPLLIRLFCRFNYFLNVSGSPEVLLGKEGWLFLKKNHNVINQSRGLDNFEFTELRDWFKIMKARHNWLFQNNIKFIIVIVPNKHTIYSEYLPSYLNKIGKTRREQINNALSSYPELTILDLTKPLMNAKNTYRLYSKGDTHWNKLGQFVGYSAIMEKLSNWFPEINPIELSAFELTEDKECKGDLYKLLNIKCDFRNSEPELRTLYKAKVNLVRTLQGRYKPIQIWNNTNISKPVALIFGDSYLVFGSSDLYKHTFGITILTHHMGQSFDKTIVEEFKPDVVIYQIAERLLDRYPKNPFNSLR